MSTLPFVEAVSRLQSNEDRLNVFVNDPDSLGHYMTSESVQVETLPSLVSKVNDTLTDFNGRWYGPLSADPALDPNGNAVGIGDAYWNTTSNRLLVYSGSAWVAAFSDSSLVAFKQAGTGAVDRTAQEKMRESISVKDFGAVGDGVTDDTTSIQAALNAAAGARWALYFPKGVYLIAAALTGGRDTTIYGDGWRSTIRVANGTNPAHILKFGDETGVTSVEVRDIEFDGNKTGNPTGGDGLVIVRGYKANLFNVRVIDCVGDGIQYEAAGSCFENYLYSVSSYRNDGYGIRMTGGGVTDTHIIGGDIGYNATGGVVLATSCSVNNATIWGGGQPNSRGVVSAGVSFQIVGNRIEGHGQHGIYIQSGNHYGYISGNKIYANSFTAENSDLYDGIYVEANANFGTVSGNKVYSSVAASSPYATRYALNFAGAHSQWTVFGNDFPLLTPGNPAAFKTGMVVNGVLTTDKCDFNWIRSNVLATLASNFNAAAADTWTAFPFNTEGSDTLAEFSAGTFTPKTSGLYRIECRATFTAAAANENIGIALYTNAGAAIRRLDFKRSEGVNSELVGGITDEFLTAGTAYDVRYLTGSTSTAFLAGAEFTYLKIRAVAN